MYETDRQWGPAVCTRSSALCPVVTDGWDGLGWDGGPNGGVIGLHMADSCCHIAEANTKL